ncbi:MAG: glycosyltransferase [Alphaproteobacteria bacterium]|nr:glycosyltransferase [Alphaproteobacteria bacterium]
MGRARTTGRVRSARKAPALNLHQAAFGLLEQRPEASAATPLSPPAAIIAGPLLFLAGAVLTAPLAALTCAMAGLAAYVLLVSALRLGAAMTPLRWSARRALSTTDLPAVTVIVALYGEAKVVPGLAASLSRLDYPRDRLQILFALEAGDQDTIAAARSVSRRSRIEIVVLEPCGPQTKPRALNYALQAARGDLIAVYDAEDAPHPRQLRAAAEAFAADERLAVVQAPLNWYNHQQSWLTRQFALEYAAQFNALLPLLVRLGLPLPLGGTSNVFRRDRLEAAGGWDPFNVTEDADLGFRLARHGWSAGVIAPGTGEEAPLTVKAWTGQRSRWLKGHLVSWLVQMRDPSGLVQAAGWRALAGLQLTLLANVLSAGLHGPGLALLGLSAILAGIGGDSSPALTGALLGAAAYLCAMACAATGAARAGLSARLTELLTMPVYWLLQAPALVRALRETATAPYLWVKTRHGVSTARREAPHDIAGDDQPDDSSRRPVRAGGLAVRQAG